MASENSPMGRVWHIEGGGQVDPSGTGQRSQLRNLTDAPASTVTPAIASTRWPISDESPLHRDLLDDTVPRYASTPTARTPCANAFCSLGPVPQLPDVSTHD